MGMLGEKCWRCGKRTRAKAEGIPTCPPCLAKLQAAREPAIPCPVDRVPMTKEIVSNLVLDRCPRCRGYWLQAEELELLKRAAHDEAFVTGLVIGMPL